MIPLKDEIPTNRFPFITIAIIVINVLIFLYQISQKAYISQANVVYFGIIPYRVTHFFEFSTTPFSLNPLLTFFTAMFFHGSILHIIGNMLYLWIFGNNVEDAMGHLKFLFFYILCGIISSFAHIFAEPYSKIPMIGASGAIAGVLGAYLILFPYSKVLTAVIIFVFIRLIKIPAVIILGIWFLIQITSIRSGGGVAWYAHIGGFVIGILLVNFFVPDNKYYRRMV
ncbi:MAG: rhomboid family intramembrane serine protease [Spirochaetota bacterium]|nr:rhomboid family intramembrane serine protease [Spirochaetota bacterium]